MGWFSGIVVYVVAWWLVFFAALPWGVRRASEAEAEEGQDPGAPANPRLLLKAAITTVIAGVLTFVYWLVATSGIVDIRG